MIRGMENRNILISGASVAGPALAYWLRRRGFNPTVVERFLAGEIQPMDVPGILAWMGITPDVAGDDGHQYKWAAEYLPAEPGA